MSLDENMHFYSAYNLGICSSLLLPELPSVPPSKATEDITIRLQPVRQSTVNGNHDPEYSYSISKNKAHLYFQEVGTFQIENGTEITILPLPNVEERLIRLPLLGAALAVLLYQRGKFVLHASAVAIDKEAVVFVGNKGYGKSTMAAMLCSRGHQLLADDTVVVDLDESEHYIILPGFPQFKLYPDAVIATSNDDPEKLEEVASNFLKRSRRADNFCQEALPLRAIFVLNEGTDVRISQLAPQEIIKHLLSNTYMARFSSDWLCGIAAANLQQCAAIANQIPVYLLERPRDISILEDVALAVEEQVRISSRNS
jgi:hypothetical protein